jgi:2,4-dienoyl-CoA reductase (NADPH2)
MTVRETQEVARLAQGAGLDAVTMTALGGYANFPSSPGALLTLARAIKQAVTIPVTATGRMDLRVGERALLEGKGDLVGIEIYTSVKAEEFRESSLVITTREGEEKGIEVNTLVIATGSRPNTALLKDLEGVVSETYCVGGCREPRNVLEATTDGFSVGMRL